VDPSLAGVSLSRVKIEEPGSLKCGSDVMDEEWLPFALLVEERGQ
jgi:hypothetical protein